MRRKRFLSIALTLVMLLGMIPGMSLTASAGGNTTTITPGTDDAKTGTGHMTITLKIKAAQTITASDVTATYGDTDKAISASVTTPSTGGGTISYAVKEGSGDYISVASDGKLTIKKVPPTDGKAYVIVTAAATDDYAETTKEVTVTISKAEATVIALNQSIMVGGMVPDLSAPVLDTHYSVTGLVGEETLTTNPTLVYQKDGSAATPDNTTAGTYDIVPSGAAASDNYSISYTNGTLTISNKGTQTITAENVTAAYGDTDASVSATLTTGNGAISYAVKDGSGEYIEVNSSTGALTIKKVGTATVIVTAAETSTYAQATKEVTVTINKASAVAATITANNRTYDGTEKPLVTVDNSTLVGGEMQYALGNATEATEPYTTSIPTATSAGTYYVWYKAAGDDNHNDSDPACLTVTIQNAGVTPEVPELGSLIYNGTAQELVTEGTASGGTMYYALGEDGTTAPAFYLDEAKTQINTAKWSTSVPTGTDAGTYHVWYMVKGDANHNDTEPACVNAEIAKKELIITADAKSKTAGEADPPLTYTLDGLVSGDAVSGALSREAGEAVGTYPITQGTLTAGDNYAITFTAAVLTVKEAPSSGGGDSSGGTAYDAAGGGGAFWYPAGGSVQNQSRAAYSDVIGAVLTSCGVASSDYSCNVELACEKINGVILQPGEVFSFNEAVGARTLEAGFRLAPVYSDDDAEAEIGGGVSQVASTLYASSLMASLETVERSSHEYVVPFIQPGTDARVTNPEDGGLDLRFRNNRIEPVKIVVELKKDGANRICEIVVEIRSALAPDDFMPVCFDNSRSGDSYSVLYVDPIDPTRPGYSFLLEHEEQRFTDDRGEGIRTLTHRRVLYAEGRLYSDEILNPRRADGSYVTDTYYNR